MVLNLTPHDLHIRVPDCQEVVLPREKEAARVTEELTLASTTPIGGVEVPIMRRRWGAVENLPAERCGMMYVVSLVTAQAALAQTPGRGDLLTPGEPVRDADGKIIGCKSLILAE